MSLLLGEPLSVAKLAIPIRTCGSYFISWEFTGCHVRQIANPSPTKGVVLPPGRSPICQQIPPRSATEAWRTEVGASDLGAAYAFRGRDAPAQDCTPDGPTLSDQEAVICAADSGIGQQ